MNTEKLYIELKRQLMFIKNSCLLYDSGSEDEAVRIATAIRVIMYDTNKSKSILHQANAKSIKLASSIEQINDKDFLAYGGRLSQLKANIQFPKDSGDVPKVIAKSIPLGLSVFEKQIFIPLDEWWNQNIYLFIQNNAFSRHDVIRTAANKDGGAHVDKTLPPMYALLKSGMASSFSEPADEFGMATVHIDISTGHHIEGGEPIENFQYADIRQMASELFRSPELLQLCGLSVTDFISL